ncbi:MAG: glycoside hydrolase family 127 protein [Planctomycetota bacterium]|nr:glycoside hydrolase family 127 protein [Planctomycetota bacterium]
MTIRTFSLLWAAVAASVSCAGALGAAAAVSADARPGANLAVVATASTSFVSGHETLAALNDGFTPAHSDDKSRGAYGNWPQSGTQWVQYDWSRPIKTNRMDVYWFDDQRGVRLPKACRLKYWDGSAFVTVTGASGLGLAASKFNTTDFQEITTTRLRLEFDGQEKFSTGLLEWRVYDSGGSPNFAPSVNTGADRVVVLSGQTYLNAVVKDDGKPTAAPAVRWSRDSGPGAVTFGDATGAATTARFTAPGDYVLRLTADDGQLSSSATVAVTADPPPPAVPLDAVATTGYALTSPLWRSRAKALIVNWIPHCVRKIEDPETREGGIENYVQACRKLAGQPARHAGAVFANTWVYNTLESMCIAMLVDAQGDEEILQAQADMRKTIEDWIPKILSAQEKDGYLHTLYTIQGRRRWSNKHDHEGYQAGYFMEAAMAHDRMTGGKDARLYEAAKRLADCWCDNIGPAPKKAWYEGHQELEQALVRFARFVEEKEGPGKGRKYVDLAKFLLDSRRNGEEYDQSHLPVTRQYEAVGHAVRAVYSYSGMADIAMETGDADYHSAIKSIWSNIVNRKYYVTGGVGSGETAEGFGKDYSLPNNAYCESCAGCGELFFQHKMNRAYQEGRYADLYEETLYNAILGGIDLEGKNFTYTNALDSGGRRYPWHGCPCCVGNLPRTLLSLPTWMYSRSADSLYVNLLIGSTVTVDNVASTRVQLVQATDYPWSGNVALTVNPAEARRFSIRIRAANRNVSRLYTASPACDGIVSLAVNGTPVTPALERGYAVLTRQWKAGDRIDLVLPMQVQRVKGSSRIAATAGRVALRYGPLIYNIESVDQDINSVLGPTSALSTEWKGDLLGGVLIIKGTFSDGKPLTAIPNYARLNRGGRSIVWIKDQ